MRTGPSGPGTAFHVLWGAGRGGWGDFNGVNSPIITAGPVLNTGPGASFSVAAWVDLYINGKPQGTATDTTPYASHGSLAIGRAQFGAQNIGWFPGRINDVEVFQQALTPAEIKALWVPVGGGERRRARVG